MNDRSDMSVYDHDFWFGKHERTKDIIELLEDEVKRRVREGERNQYRDNSIRGLEIGIRLIKKEYGFK